MTYSQIHVFRYQVEKMLQTNNFTNNKDNRLESIKQVHSEKNLKFSSRMEDYLEVIYELVKLKGYASPTTISNYMNVRPSSVTSMLQRLSENCYIEYTKYRGLKLNPDGEKLAQEIHQKHSQLVDFFEIIGVDNSIANKDAEGIEHHLHPQTLKQLQKFTALVKSKPDLLKFFD